MRRNRSASEHPARQLLDTINVGPPTVAAVEETVAAIAAGSSIELTAATRASLRRTLMAAGEEIAALRGGDIAFHGAARQKAREIADEVAGITGEWQPPRDDSADDLDPRDLAGVIRRSHGGL